MKKWDLDELKKAVGPQTKMIVAVSVLGNPCNFDEIVKYVSDSVGDKNA